MRWPWTWPSRTRAELARLRESEARYRLLAEHARDVIVQYDAAGMIRYVSPSMVAFGHAPDAVIGRHVLDFTHPDDLAVVQRRVATLNAGERLSDDDCEVRFLHGDGHWLWVQGRPAPVSDAEGRPAGVITILRDVTEQRGLEAALRQGQADAQAATAAKSEFLANMSHEIRTPLTAVVGFASLLAKMDGVPDRGRVYAGRIAKSGEALTSIVNNVLDLSKVEAGQVVLKPEPFELGAFADELLGVLEDEARAKGLSLTAEIMTPASGALLADAGRLRQVALNLLANAVKFTHRGGVALELSHEAGILHVAVRDTGIGISPASAGRLFQRFSQVDTSNTRRFGGAGLGLAISRGLVELMGGDIGVDSVEGEGSAFWFRVPAPAATTTAIPVEPEAARPLAGARVLVVDDARANRELILALLSPFELQLTEAADGLEALEAARHAPFDLVLMDLQMPGLDGIAATRAIRDGDLNRRTPILAVSASVQPSDVEACRRAGMDDHIPKPIDPRELLGKIARWTGDAHGGCVN